MPTVGYGDFYPTSDPGRFFMTMVILWGVAATSIMIVSVNNELTLTKSENKATNMIDMLEAHENIKTKASHVMENLLKTYKLHKNKSNVSEKNVNKLHYAIQEFKTSLRYYK